MTEDDKAEAWFQFASELLKWLAARRMRRDLKVEEFDPKYLAILGKSSRTVD